jgi:hypothetical protein
MFGSSVYRTDIKQPVSTFIINIRGYVGNRGFIPWLHEQWYS